MIEATLLALPLGHRVWSYVKGLFDTAPVLTELAPSQDSP
jgi:hypothetical protein